jgi:hypothetical protein
MDNAPLLGVEHSTHRFGAEGTAMDILNMAREAGFAVLLDGRLGQEEYSAVSGSKESLQCICQCGSNGGRTRTQPTRPIRAGFARNTSHGRSQKKRDDQTNTQIEVTLAKPGMPKSTAATRADAAQVGDANGKSNTSGVEYRLLRPRNISVFEGESWTKKGRTRLTLIRRADGDR